MRLNIVGLWAILAWASLWAETTGAGGQSVSNLGASSEGPGLFAHFQTSRGEIVARLFFEETPLTVTSFVGLAEGELPTAGSPKYFTGLTFHRVVPGFVVQGGDPLGTGEGGPGYAFPDEFVPGLRHGTEGILSMANSGPDTNGSQFFFTLAPVHRLNYLHSVFGVVVRGGEVLRSIQKGDTFSVSIERRGEAAEAFVATRAHFDALLAQARRAQPPHFADPEGLLPSDPPREKAFNVKLQNFERFTGAKVYARLYPVRDPVERDLTPEQIAARRAVELGVGEGGWVAVYLADTASWGVWLGGLEPRWQPAGIATDQGSPTDAKKAFFTRARVAAEAAAAKLAAEGRTLTPADRLKLEVDEVLDGLIEQREQWLRGPQKVD